MNRTLTDADLNAIAERILELAAQRLAIPPKAPPSPPVTIQREIPTLKPTKLAYTIRELSAELGISKVSIYRLIDRGLLKSLPYLRTKVFTRQEVERFLAAGSNWSGK